MPLVSRTSLSLSRGVNRMAGPRRNRGAWTSDSSAHDVICSSWRSGKFIWGWAPGFIVDEDAWLSLPHTLDGRRDPLCSDPARVLRASSGRVAISNTSAYPNYRDINVHFG